MLTTAGCPVEVAAPGTLPGPQVTPQPEANEADPRVERQGEDLYPAKTLERADGLRRVPDSQPEVVPAVDPELPPEAEGTPGLGSGQPDETNGVCRLFAPKLPQPECCAADLGFDVEVVKQACGADVYLGESFQGSCGYFFLGQGGGSTWFRLSHVAEPDVASAVATHYRQAAMQGAPPAQGIGVPGAVRSRHEGYNWVFLPGWDDGVRLLTWRDGTCSDQGIQTIVRKLMAAKQPAKGSKRALLPTAAY